MVFPCYSREWLKTRREEIRPWSTFVATSNFGKPEGVPSLTRRIYKNLDHYQSNYVSIMSRFHMRSMFPEVGGN